jgi:pilus assembly protein CpaB
VIRTQSHRCPPWANNQNKLHSFALILILALVGITAYAYFNTLKKEPYRPPALAATFDQVQLLVPKDLIKAGQKLESLSLELRGFPSHLAPVDALTILSSDESLYALASLPVGAPISRKSLSSNSQAALNPVLSSIPKGMRAMAVRVDATTAVEGWAGSGSVVDLLLIESKKTILVAEDVRILSAERSTTPIDSSGAPEVPSTVTLLVTQEQCLAINTAIPRGRLALVLKGSEDRTVWSRRIMSYESLSPSLGQGLAKVAGVVIANNQKYALVDGRWTVSASIPAGFFYSQQELSDERE